MQEAKHFLITLNETGLIMNRYSGQCNGLSRLKFQVFLPKTL